MLTITRAEKPPDLRGVVESLKSRLNTAERARASVEAEGMMASQLVQRWKNNAPKASQFPGEVVDEKCSSVLMHRLRTIRFEAALTTQLKAEDETQGGNALASDLPATSAPQHSPLKVSVSQSALERVEYQKPTTERVNHQHPGDVEVEKAEACMEELAIAKAEAAERMEELKRERAAAESRHADWLAASQRELVEARARAEDDVKHIRMAVDATKEELKASVAHAEAEAALAIQRINEKVALETSRATSRAAREENTRAIEDTDNKLRCESPRVSRPVRDSSSSFLRSSNDASSVGVGRENEPEEQKQLQEVLLHDFDVWDDSLIMLSPPEPDEERLGAEKNDRGDEDEDVDQSEPSERTRQAVRFILRGRLFLHVTAMAIVSFARPRRKRSSYLQAASPRILKEIFSP